MGSENKNIKIDLIIDGNYLLSKMVYSLAKYNILYGALFDSLVNSFDKLNQLLPFSNVYFTSDSKNKSWRKDLMKKYKANRTKDSKINWEFVYETYEEFKKSLSKYKYVKVLTVDKVEGDDWISFIVENSNKEKRSTFIISNDYDMKQLINFNLDPLYINVMSNDMYNKETLFLPENYQLFLNELNKYPNTDLFNLNNNELILKFFLSFIERNVVKEVNKDKSLFIKLISGDRGDNIDSVWLQRIKNGKTRGIGEAGATSIYNSYLEEFGEVDMQDNDLYENFADIICEKKKISKNNIEFIANKLKFNYQLIKLSTDNIPTEILESMINEFNKNG